MGDDAMVWLTTSGITDYSVVIFLLFVFLLILTCSHSDHHVNRYI